MNVPLGFDTTLERFFFIYQDNGKLIEMLKRRKEEKQLLYIKNFLLLRKCVEEALESI